MEELFAADQAQVSNASGHCVTGFSVCATSVFTKSLLSSYKSGTDIFSIIRNQYAGYIVVCTKKNYFVKLSAELYNSEK